MAEHVAHHKHVAVFIVHTNSVHAQELGQQRVAMALHNVLGWKGGTSGEWLSSRYTKSLERELKRHSRVGQKTSSKEVTKGKRGESFLNMPPVFHTVSKSSSPLTYSISFKVPFLTLSLSFFEIRKVGVIILTLDPLYLQVATEQGLVITSAYQ